MADDDRDQDQRPELDLQQLAAAEAVRQLVGLVTVMAGTAGIVYLMNHRYVIEQLAKRGRAWWDNWQHPNRIQTARALVELQREISLLEHPEQAPARDRPRGLYERGAA